MKNSNKPAHATPRRGRPLRAVFGLLVALLGSAALIAALAPVGERYGMPVVTDTAKLSLTAYGAAMFVLAVWALATSGPGRADRASENSNASRAPKAQKEPKRRGKARPSDAERLLSHASVGTIDLDPASLPEVITPLRAHGWYVAEAVSLPHADADYVAIGPAGVLVVQTMVSTRPDPRGRASIRARVAAQQLEKLLRQREIHVEVVPAVVAFGPGQDDQTPGGVRIVDNVAILFGDRVREWFPALIEREHINSRLQQQVREVVGDLLETVVAARTHDRVHAGA